MNRSVVTAIGLCVMSSGAFAQDWSGFYGGLSLGADAGDMLYRLNGNPNGGEQIDGTRAGLFAGYNRQVGSMIYGGELAFSSGDTEYDPGYGFTRFVDLKARVGYAVDAMLIYGTLGYTSGEWKEEGFEALTSDGIAAGFGVDYRVSDRMFVGAEYLWRDVTSENFPAPVDAYSVDGTFGTLSLRLGMSF